MKFDWWLFFVEMTNRLPKWVVSLINLVHTLITMILRRLYK